MSEWLRQQWHDIEGNVKFALVAALGGPAMTGLVAVTHGLALWQQMVLTACGLTLFVLAIFATASRPSAATPAAEAKESEASTAQSIPPDAPRLLLSYTKRDRIPGEPQVSRERLVYTHAGGAPMVSVDLGLLTWTEARMIQQISPVGVLAPGQTEERQFYVVQPDGSMSDLYGFLRSSTQEHAVVSLTALITDVHGRRFSQELRPTTQVDGTITFTYSRLKAVDP